MPVLSRPQPSPDPHALDAFARAWNADSPSTAMRIACRRLANDAHETTPPVRLNKLLASCGARFETSGNIATHGRLELRDGQYTVIARRGVAWRRQRFTIAHEVGHIIILNSLARWPSALSALHSPTIWEPLERLCDLAAAELLVPEADLSQAAELHELTANGLQRLYDRYLVSYATLLRRICELSPRRALSLWRRYARHSHEATNLRITYAYAGADAPWLPRGLTAKHLQPNLVELACQAASHQEAEVELVFGRRRTGYQGRAFLLGHRSDTLPMFERHTIADERFPETVLLQLEAA